MRFLDNLPYGWVNGKFNKESSLPIFGRDDFCDILKNNFTFITKIGTIYESIFQYGGFTYEL